MKFSFLILGLLAWASSSSAQASLQDLSQIAPRMRIIKAPIHWQVQAPSSKSKVQIYPVKAGISEARKKVFLELKKKFTAKDLVSPYSMNGIFLTPGVEVYRHKKTQATMQVVPQSGWLSFLDNSDTRKVTATAPEAPSVKDLVNRAREMAQKLGIDAAKELRSNAYITDEKAGLAVPKNKSVREFLVYREIMLPRMIDGHEVLSLYPRSGLAIGYGNTGKIEKLELVWRELGTPAEKSSIDKSQIEKLMRSGEAYVFVDDPKKIDATHMRGEIAGVDIEAIELCYFERPANEIQNEITPVYRLSVELETVEKVKIPATLIVPAVI